MYKEFEMTDLGLMHYFLGLEIWQDKDRIFISQRKYTLDLLQKFKINGCKPLVTLVEVGIKLSKLDDSAPADPTLYKQLIRSLIYLTSIRPNIMHAINLVSRFMQDPKSTHWQAAKRILQYLKGTTEYGLHYKPSPNFRLTGHTDLD